MMKTMSASAAHHDRPGYLDLYGHPVMNEESLPDAQCAESGTTTCEVHPCRNVRFMPSQAGREV